MSASKLIEFDDEEMSFSLRDDQPARKQDVGVHRIKVTLKDKYEVSTQYTMLVAILDNSLESQMYKEILDECDWEEEFA